ncbi:MAG: hypothetical protein QW478_11705 [Candidatus Micrarchaeaceae archaeon]
MNKRTSDEDKIKSLKEFKKNYLTLDKDKLILFTVHFLEKKGIEPTHDKITATAFKLFPQKFALIGFPEYPDSLSVYYSVYHHDTKTKGWLTGNPKSGYTVTDKGNAILELVEDELNGKIIRQKRQLQYIVPKRKEAYFLGEFKKSAVFKKTLSGDFVELSDIKNALGLTSDTSKEITLKVLTQYLEYAIRLKDAEVEKALRVCEEIVKR